MCVPGPRVMKQSVASEEEVYRESKAIDEEKEDTYTEGSKEDTEITI